MRNANQVMDVLERFRLERDLTYRELAQRLNVSESTVIRLINPPRTLPLKRTLFKVRRLLESEGIDLGAA